MARIGFVQRLASRIMRTGLNKVWIDPQESQRIAEVKTRNDVRKLIEDKIVIKKLDHFNTRAKSRERLEAKKKGRHMGPGKKKGTRNARMSDHKIWIKKIRNMRSKLKELKDENKLTNSEYRIFRQKAKGNLFKNQNVMVNVILQEQIAKKREKELENQTKVLNINKD